MQTNLTAKPAMLAVILVLITIMSWELYLWHNGYTPDFDDGPELWADKRTMVYENTNKSTVIVGSSRIKYDIDIPTWRNLTGTDIIQLAMTGSSPRHIITDLADDPDFKGKLIVDVTEGLFFSERGNIKPDEGINYYKKRTPAQQVSFVLDKPLESKLVFLNESHFSLGGLLNRIHVPYRREVYGFIDFIYTGD